MTNESLKVSHLAATSVDADDPTYDGQVGVKLLAKAVVALAAKIDVLAAKMNADAGITDTNYAVNFEDTVEAVTL